MYKVTPRSESRGLDLESPFCLSERVPSQTQHISLCLVRWDTGQIVVAGFAT